MTDNCRAILAACMAQPTETTPVKILADAIEEAGCHQTAEYVRANGIALDNGGGGGGFGGDADGGGGGDGDGDAGDGSIKLNGAYIMTDGFYLLAIRAGYSPYVLVGWVERRDFLVRVRNCRIVRRFGQSMQLTQLATDGPRVGDNPTQLLDMADEEWVPLSSFARIKPANPKKWPMCPKPKG